jgi:hypothetical protein
MWLLEVREVQYPLTDCGNVLLSRECFQMFEVPSTPYSPICPRCSQPVRLEDAKTDEDGRAMHEDCYYAGLKGTMPITGSQTN